MCTYRILITAKYHFEVSAPMNLRLEVFCEVSIVSDCDAGGAMFDSPSGITNCVSFWNRSSPIKSCDIPNHLGGGVVFGIAIAL